MRIDIRTFIIQLATPSKSVSQVQVCHYKLHLFTAAVCQNIDEAHDSGIMNTSMSSTLVRFHVFSLPTRF